MTLAFSLFLAKRIHYLISIVDVEISILYLILLGVKSSILNRGSFTINAADWFYFIGCNQAKAAHTTVGIN